MSRRSRRSRKARETIWTSSTGMPRWNQSPVDLNSMYTYHERLPRLLIEGHICSFGNCKLSNIGNTVKVELPEGRTAYLKGGPLFADYQFSDMQFRWGPTDSRGAEHSIEETWFSMEAQAIHWNTSYGSIEKCLEKPDGFAILSFLFQVIGCPGTRDNPNVACITDKLVHVALPGRSVEIPPESLKWMLEVCNDPGYYTYKGSFTTPPYTECVTWIIIPRPVKISARQMAEFRNLYNNKYERILSNYRGTQKIHERKVAYATESLTRSKQSPIDIKDEDTCPRYLPPLIMTGHWYNDGDAIMYNSGITVSIHLTGDRLPSIIKCGPLQDDYELHNCHFHWGDYDCKGSEHTINGTWYSMEAHAVHWNRKYGSFMECLKHEDGLCCVVFLFLVTDVLDCRSFSMLEKMTDNLKYIREPETSTEIPANSLAWFRQGVCNENYYFYRGSYNSGNHPECMIYIIMPNSVPIRADQLAEFRKLKNKKNELYTENDLIRKIQPLKDRKVYKAFPLWKKPPPKPPVIG